MQVQKQLLQEYGHEPTPDEVADEMNLPVERVQQIMKMAQQPISLQSPVGDGDDTSFGDFIEDKSAENPYDMTAYSLLREKIVDVLDSLTERERRVLSLRFGLVDGYSRTLEEVGKQFKVTRERIRQIEAKALRKMRHPTRIRQLHGFFDAEQIDNAQNLMKIAASPRVPAALRWALLVRLAAARCGWPRFPCAEVLTRRSAAPPAPHFASMMLTARLLTLLAVIFLAGACRHVTPPAPISSAASDRSPTGALQPSHQSPRRSPHLSRSPRVVLLSSISPASHRWRRWGRKARNSLSAPTIFAKPPRLQSSRYPTRTHAWRPDHFRATVAGATKLCFTRS